MYQFYDLESKNSQDQIVLKMGRDNPPANGQSGYCCECHYLKLNDDGTPIAQYKNNGTLESCNFS